MSQYTTHLILLILLILFVFVVKSTIARRIDEVNGQLLMEKSVLRNWCESSWVDKIEACWHYAKVGDFQGIIILPYVLPFLCVTVLIVPITLAHLATCGFMWLYRFFSHTKQHRLIKQHKDENRNVVFSATAQHVHNAQALVKGYVRAHMLIPADIVKLIIKFYPVRSIRNLVVSYSRFDVLIYLPNSTNFFRSKKSTENKFEIDPEDSYIENSIPKNSSIRINKMFSGGDNRCLILGIDGSIYLLNNENEKVHTINTTTKFNELLFYIGISISAPYVGFGLALSTKGELFHLQLSESVDTTLVKGDDDFLSGHEINAVSWCPFMVWSRVGAEFSKKLTMFKAFILLQERNKTNQPQPMVNNQVYRLFFCSKKIVFQEIKKPDNLIFYSIVTSENTTLALAKEEKKDGGTKYSIYVYGAFYSAKKNRTMYTTQFKKIDPSSLRIKCSNFEDTPSTLIAGNKRKNRFFLSNENIEANNGLVILPLCFDIEEGKKEQHGANNEKEYKEKEREGYLKALRCFNPSCGLLNSFKKSRNDDDHVGNQKYINLENPIRWRNQKHDNDYNGYKPVCAYEDVNDFLCYKENEVICLDKLVTYYR